MKAGVRRMPAYSRCICLAFTLLMSACKTDHDGLKASKPSTIPAVSVLPASTTNRQLGSEAQVREQIANQVAAAWRRGDFQWLDSTADEYIRTRAKTQSGKWRLAVFYSALSDQLEIDWPVEWHAPGTACRCKIPDPTHYEEANRRWYVVRQKVDEWVKQAPQSAHAKLALAQMLVNEAWFYRGTGYSASILPEAQPLISRYLEEAEHVLSESKAVRSVDPEWFDIMFFVASAQSWPEEEMAPLFGDLHRWGRSYTTAYQSAASTLLPKWGGSYDALERFARQAAVDFGDDGLEIYTRIYWNAVRADSFAEAHADWLTMRSGFEFIIQHYPDPRNWNGLAMYACGAGDGMTFRRAMGELGDSVTPDTWSISVDACVGQYGRNVL